MGLYGRAKKILVVPFIAYFNAARFTDSFYARFGFSPFYLHYLLGCQIKISWYETPVSPHQVPGCNS